MDYKVYSMDFAGRKLTLEFGKYAQQAGGSVLVRYGETVVLVNATASETPREGMDFFPLWPWQSAIFPGAALPVP